MPASSSSGAFEDRSDAKLILELEQALLDSPNFSLAKFRQSLLSKDMYGNDQASKQNVVMAARQSNLNIRWRKQPSEICLFFSN